MSRRHSENRCLLVSDVECISASLVILTFACNLKVTFYSYLSYIETSPGFTHMYRYIDIYRRIKIQRLGGLRR